MVAMVVIVIVVVIRLGRSKDQSQYLIREPRRRRE